MSVPVQAPEAHDNRSGPLPDTVNLASADHFPDDLIDHLRCPVTDGAVRWMNEGELKHLNDSIRDERVRHLDHSPAYGPIIASLINADGSLCYRVDDGILIMLPISAIALNAEALSRYGSEQRAEKIAIQSFYDRIGWKRDEKGDFEDAAVWEDLREVSADYLHQCHLRVKRFLKPTGNYLLDVASGPVQYADYLAYSEGYNRRICMDISIQALREARRKVGGKGVYILGDITSLPLRTDSIDGIVSLHTIYHVPVDEQANAFEEVFRVLKPGHSAVIVYTFSHSMLELLFAFPARFMIKARHSAPARMIKRLIRHRSGPTPEPRRKDLKPGSPFYFKAHNLEYFESRKWSFPIDIHVWRSVNVWWLRTYVHANRMGKRLLKILYWAEEKFPHFMGRKGPYPMFVLRK